MKFGRQLQLGIYEPWTEYYLAYGRLKRIIMRTRFINSDRKSKAAAVKHSESNMSLAMRDNSGSGMPREDTALLPKHSGKDKQKDKEKDSTASAQSLEEGGGEEFFPLLETELKKINNFYVGKASEIKLSLDLIQVKRQNWLQSHHTGNKPSDLMHIRDLYIDCKALVSYQKLNKTAFVKIIKKYDKVMHEEHLEEWVSRLANEPFVCSNEAQVLLDSVSESVSRDKLVEWERVAKETIGKNEDDVLPQVKVKSLVVCIGLFLVSLAIPDPLGNNDGAAARCMSLLILVVSMWITQAIPYFATGLLVPVLVTVLGVLKTPDGKGVLSTHEASQFVMDHMTNHTTFLLLGGYTISAAFSRCELEVYIASWLQQKLGKSPKLFILAVMFLGLFLSMWISNHTAPILCASILIPIVEDLPQDSRFTKGLLLGLAYACNFGGMTTPIASLQNALAVSQLTENGISVSFGRWILVSVPFCVLCTLIGWGLILVLIKPDDVDHIPAVMYKHSGPITSKRNLTVISLCVSISVLFATSQFTKDYVGDIGILSLAFIVVMFGTGLLSEVDFNALSWHTLFLLGGGNVLGKAIASSNLLNYISDQILTSLPYDDPWLTMLCILMFCLFVATFVSHTVASLILMPVISRIGMDLGIPKTVVVGSAFAISAGMALPFSSFPNVNSMLIVDDFQKPYLSTNDFAVSGGLLSVVATILVATFGYVMIEAIL